MHSVLFCHSICSISEIVQDIEWVDGKLHVVAELTLAWVFVGAQLTS